MTERLISANKVTELTSLHRTTIYRMERDGLFPRAINVSTCRKAYRESDVQAWIASKIAQAEAA